MFHQADTIALLLNIATFRNVWFPLLDFAWRIKKEPDKYSRLSILKDTSFFMWLAPHDI